MLQRLSGAFPCMQSPFIAEPADGVPDHEVTMPFVVVMFLSERLSQEEPPNSLLL